MKKTHENLDWPLLATALLGALGVAAAAFHAHGLSRMTTEEGMRWWGTAVFVQLVTLPLVVGLLRTRPRPLRAVGFLLSGVCIFCGSLYAMTCGAPRALGAVTPVGGLFLIIGWVLVGFSSTGSRESGDATS